VQLYRYFVIQSSEFRRHNPSCCFSTNVYYCCLFRYRLSPETFQYTLVHRRPDGTLDHATRVYPGVPGPATWSENCKW